jgi:hypothetical protein
MRARSWMAVWALIVGISIAIEPELLAREQSSTDPTDQSGEPKPSDSQSTKGTRKPSDPRFRAAKLNLVIAGLGRDGCDVEIKPGNASCKFRALNENGAESRQHVTSAGKATLDLLDIELRGADRTCSVAITVLEPGQPAKTIYRGFRLSARTEGAGSTASKTAAVPSFTCYLSSPSKVTRVDPGSRTRK